MCSPISSASFRNESDRKACGARCQDKIGICPGQTQRREQIHTWVVLQVEIQHHEYEDAHQIIAHVCGAPWERDLEADQVDDASDDKTGIHDDMLWVKMRGYEIMG